MEAALRRQPAALGPQPIGAGDAITPLSCRLQRTAIERLLEQSPSLRRMLDEEIIERVYGKAVRDAVIDTDLERHLFPVRCPYRLAQILDEDWLPEA
ncbi:DUF29 family protein [Thiococcus pfennigii]|uniref:DUF29 family protein n=1 Tax=Thiococcus pfennigii TaxID=1057 RepID=UPI001903DEE4|nr:hypothetical protein [Thiococcus pfennigii]